MYLKRIVSYILGYIQIKVEGYYIERFINICKKNKILLWNINRERDCILKCNIAIKDFKNVIKIGRQTKCKINIEKKRGFPFKANRYKKRKFFLIMFFILVIVVIMISNFIWDVEVEGTESIDKNEIIEEAQNLGLRIGVLKFNVNTQEIIDKIRLDRKDISWVAIDISGTKATIKIVEATTKPDIIDEDDFCNIVATKDGIIQKIKAVNGTPLVKEGDVVTKGDILVAGWLEGKYTGTRYVHANAEIEAKTWYGEKEKVFLKKEEKEGNGNFETSYSVKINKFKINFQKGVPNFKIYDTITESKKVKIFSDIYLPIEIIKNTYYEQEYIKHEYTIEEAEKIATEQARNRAYEQIENKENIVNEIIKTHKNTDYVEVEVIEEVVESIGTKEKIVF